MAGVDESESASGVLTSVQQLGGAFGIAVLGTVFRPALSGTDAATQVGAYREAAATSVWIAAALMGLAFALTFLFPERAREGATGH